MVKMRAPAVASIGLLLTLAATSVATAQDRERGSTDRTDAKDEYERTKEKYERAQKALEQERTREYRTRIQQLNRGISLGAWVSADLDLSKSYESASRHRPPCGNYRHTTADAVVGLIETAVARGIPIPIGAGAIVKAVGSNYKLRDRIKLALGIHDGKSVCGNLCVAVPGRGYSGRTLKARLYAWDKKNLAWLANRGLFDIGWASLDRITMASVEDSTIICANVRNWKHDRPRHFELHVTYSDSIRKKEEWLRHKYEEHAQLMEEQRRIEAEDEARTGLIAVENNCEKDVKLLLHWYQHEPASDLGGGRRTGGLWVVKGKVSRQTFKWRGNPVQTDRPRIYYWAQSLDKTSIWRGNDDARTYKLAGERYKVLSGNLRRDGKGFWVLPLKCSSR